LLGPNRFNWDALGDPPSYVITFQAPLRSGQKLLRARLFFTPLTGEITNLPAPEVPSTHTWVLTAPRCHVEGTLQWCNAGGESEKEQGFVGSGYHDHHFGSVPLDRFVKSWRWGRAFLGDQTLVYSIQAPMDEREKPESIVVWLDKNKTARVERSRDIAFSKPRRNFFFLPHPKTIIVQGAEPLKIQPKKILSDGPVSLILEDQVESKGFKASGLSTYLYTPRLSSRFFFPLLKGKTTVFTPPWEAAPASLNQPGGDVFTDRSSLK
jgi:carotenoid 1,2-hydratase